MEKAVWPGGDGRMARRIREYDWSGTALGPLAAWPPELKTLIGVVLASASPMGLYWGAELILLHNDAWSELLGGQRFLGLGRPAEAMFHDDWPELAPLFERVMGGDGSAAIEERRLPIDRDGAATDAWFDFTFDPVPLGDASIAGVLSIAEDVKARVEDRRRRASIDGLRASEERNRIELEQRIAAATAELKASRDLLKATMDASIDMIQVFEAVRDEEGRIIDFNWVLNNHTSESRYGKVRGETLLTRNPGVLEEDIFDAFRRVTETGIPEQAEHHYVHEQFDGWFYQSVVKLNDGVATTTKEISEWKRAQAALFRLQEESAAAALREKDEFQRLILASALDYAIFTIDENGFVTSWPPGAQAVYGWSEAEMLGQDFAVTFMPDDRASDQPRQERETAARTGVAPNVRWHLHKDGRRIFIEGSTRPLQAGGESRPGGFIKIGQDVTARRQAERSLRESRRRLQTMIEGIPQLVWRSGTDGRWTWSSPQWSEYTGLSEEESLGLGWLNALHPDDREAAMASWARADGSSHLEMEARLFHVGEGQYRWFQTRALPVRDEDGVILEWLGTSTDIDDLRQLQDRQEVLLAELQHRTRNLISVVRGIADKTAAKAGSLTEFSQRFRDRLSALSRINTLLSKLGQGERITFDEMIRTEFAARGVLESDKAERVVLDGPEGIRLRSATVQTFALAIHELTTNAVKYGALSNGRGRLRVSWRVAEDEAGRQRLMVEWVETDIADMPEADAAPQGSGYGRELIERALPYQLRAKTSYELGAGGVRCTIELPLA